MAMLLEGELVSMAFAKRSSLFDGSKKDCVVLTNRRILLIDVGMSSRAEYKSIPYTSIRGFSAETCGTWDRDAELTIYTKTHWDMRVINMVHPKLPDMSHTYRSSHDDVQHIRTPTQVIPLISSARTILFP